jgi:hypothetical protein
MTNYLEHKRSPLRFCVRSASVATVSLEGTTVVGKWKNAHPALDNVSPERQLRRFANWSSDPDQILRFTKQHGPLTVPSFGRGQRFSFGLSDWQRAQKKFRTLWDKQTTSAGRQYLLGGRWLSVATERGEELAFVFGQWEYVTSTLERLLLLGLMSTPYEKLRLCEKKSCKTRYFVASHGREKYCSPPCKAWAQRVAKAKWARTTYTERRRKAARSKGAKKR